MAPCTTSLADRSNSSTSLPVRHDVRDTDIDANFVIGSLREPFRSVAVAPVLIDGARVAGLTAVDPRRDAFSPARLYALVEAAALLAPAFASSDAAAA